MNEMKNAENGQQEQESWTIAHDPSKKSMEEMKNGQQEQESWTTAHDPLETSMKKARKRAGKEKMKRKRNFCFTSVDLYV